MPDYQHGKIYTIRCRTDDTLIYVGSTIQSLAKRWGGHKCKSKTEKCKNMLIYKTINNNWDNWYIELHTLYPCNSKEELCKKEGEIIRKIGTLNKKIEGRTEKEYREDHKEEIKKYNEDHKELLLEYQKVYRIKYWKENKEKLTEKHKLNYEKNGKEQIKCECGSVINKHSFNLHKTSQKHTLFSSRTNISRYHF